MAFGRTANKLCSGRRPKATEGRTDADGRGSHSNHARAERKMMMMMIGVDASTNGYGCAGKSPRLGSFLPSFIAVRRVRRSLPLHLFSLGRRPCANCFLCWKKQSRTGEGKSLVTPSSERRPTPKAKRGSRPGQGEGGEKNRRQSGRECT